ncbi:MAG: uncharacterized protein JWM53_5370 [bacterium]|nr:uncharacterized protein [bacterium]
MKKYAALLLIPLAACALLIAGVLSTAPDGGRLAFYRYEILAVKTLATIGCLWGALAFRRGDYLQRAWLFLGVSYFLLLVLDLFFAPPAHSGATGLAPSAMRVRGVIVLVSNLSAVVGTFMLARAWAATGLERPGSARSRRALGVVVTVIVLAVVGQSIYVDVRDLAGGNLQGFAGLASDLGDLVTLLLIVPVLLTALALRGGVLAWAWLLVSATQLSWLFYDAAGTVGFAFHLEHTQMRPVEESFRTLACTFAFISGIAQRWAIARPRKPAA